MIRATVQNDNILLIIVLLIILIGIDRYLLHRRLMKKIDHETRTSEEVNLNLSSFPTINVGLLLTGIGGTTWLGWGVGPMLFVIGALFTIGGVLRPVSSDIYNRFRDCIDEDEQGG